jgi:hypothetical protein
MGSKLHSMGCHRSEIQREANTETIRRLMSHQLRPRRKLQLQPRDSHLDQVQWAVRCHFISTELTENLCVPFRKTEIRRKSGGPAIYCTERTRTANHRRLHQQNLLILAETSFNTAEVFENCSGGNSRLSYLLWCGGRSFFNKEIGSE